MFLFNISRTDSGSYLSILLLFNRSDEVGETEAITAFKDYMASRITKELDKLPDESNGVTR